ncbi:MAG: hypothetical protein KDB11_27620 [Planctomycetales bacterium]|nr:hypothetical protein [Planctomycetales bacterium]
MLRNFRHLRSALVAETRLEAARSKSVAIVAQADGGNSVVVAEHFGDHATFD